MKMKINIDEEVYERILKAKSVPDILDIDIVNTINAVKQGIPITPDVLADALMEKRIRGELDSDITYSKDVIPDVKCKLTVSIQDYRPCYCGAGLREVWRESEE